MLVITYAGTLRVGGGPSMARTGGLTVINSTLYSLYCASCVLLER